MGPKCIVSFLGIGRSQAFQLTTLFFPFYTECNKLNIAYLKEREQLMKEMNVNRQKSCCLVVHEAFIQYKVDKPVLISKDF